GSSSGSSTSGGTTGPGSSSTASCGTTGTGTTPAVTVAADSLSVSPGHSVDLGMSVSVPTTGDDVTVNISGLPKYETITDNLDHKTFSGSNITLTADEVNSGLSLTSNYKGHGHPTATLTVTATDHTANSSSAAQSIVVKDPASTGGTTHTGGTMHPGGTANGGSTTVTGGTAPAGGTQASNPPATASGQDTSSNTHQDAGAHGGHDAAIHDLMACIQHQVQSFEHMWH